MSELSSVAPVPRVQSSSAAELQTNPVFARAAGGGRASGGRGGKGKQAASDAAPARFAPLSLLAMELTKRAASGEEDGANSDAEFSQLSESSDDEENAGVGKRGDKRPFDEAQNRKAAAEVPDADGEDECQTRRVREAWECAERGVRMDEVAAQALGMSDGAAAKHGRPGSPCTDSVSQSSRGSKRHRRDEYATVFGAKGVTCPGCALAHRIGPVDTFVATNIGRMSDMNLWKMAALVWENDVVAVAKRDGATAPSWSWRDVQVHYRMHTTNAVVGRTAMIQSLSAMRHHVEQRMLRVEGDEQELDKAAADLALKIIAAESRERTALHALSTTGRGGSSKAGAAGKSLPAADADF